jgi:hypothetical protein
MLIWFAIIQIFSLIGCQLHNEDLYPINSLTNPGDLFPFGGILPSSRIRHIVEVIHPYVFIYGGVSENNSLLDDLNIYDIRFQSWTGVISRLECCNQAEEIIERLGSDSKVPVSTLQTGFQGGIPPARADHGAAVLNNLLYMFGGMSSFGYMNDFFYFNVVELTWTTIRRVGASWPCRRAGHAMVSDSNNIVVFGGRSLLSDGSLFTLNDVWMYNAELNIWKTYPLKSSSMPLGRQYSACAIHYNNLWVFGGIDSVTGQTFNDLWSYDLILHQWTEQSPNSGSLYGFVPPPLHHASLLPSWDSPSLLIFGGISSGGSCGNTVCNPSNRSFYGQAYRYSFDVEVSSSTRLNNADSIFINNRQSTLIGDGSWSYARLISNEEWSAGGSGKYLKKYALEGLGYDRERGVMYEFGGVESSIKDQELLIASTSTSTSTSTHVSISSVISNEYHTPLPNTRTGEGEDIYESGGRLTKEYWDLSTGEQLRGNVDSPSVPDWWYEEFLDLDQRLNPTKIQFRKEFHEYSVQVEDVVLIKSQKP